MTINSRELGKTQLTKHTTGLNQPHYPMDEECTTDSVDLLAEDVLGVQLELEIARRWIES